MSKVEYDLEKIKKLPKFSDYLKREEKKDPDLRRRIDLGIKRLHLSHKIMLERKKAKLTQKEFARELETSQSFVARVESGEQNVTIAVLFKIADVLSAKRKRPVVFKIG